MPPLTPPPPPVLATYFSLFGCFSLFSNLWMFLSPFGCFSLSICAFGCFSSYLSLLFGCFSSYLSYYYLDVPVCLSFLDVNLSPFFLWMFLSRFGCFSLHLDIWMFLFVSLNIIWMFSLSLLWMFLSFFPLDVSFSLFLRMFSLFLSQSLEFLFFCLKNPPAKNVCIYIPSHAVVKIVYWVNYALNFQTLTICTLKFH